MNLILDFIINFMVVFILLCLLYYFFVNKKKIKKGYSKLKNNDEIVIFVNRYNLNVEVIGYKRILNIVTILNSIIISFASSIIMNIDSLIWSIIISFMIVLALIYSLFELTGRYLKKKEEKIIKNMEVKKCITQKKSKKNGKNIG